MSSRGPNIYTSSKIDDTRVVISDHIHPSVSESSMPEGAVTVLLVAVALDWGYGTFPLVYHSDSFCAVRFCLELPQVDR